MRQRHHRRQLRDPPTHPPTHPPIHTPSSPHVAPSLNRAQAFRTYSGGAADPRVAELRERLNQLEAELATHRNGGVGWGGGGGGVCVWGGGGPCSLPKHGPPTPSPSSPNPSTHSPAGHCLPACLPASAPRPTRPTPPSLPPLSRCVRACVRAGMALGWRDPTSDPPGAFHRASSVQLRNLMRTAEEEGVRRAAYEGLR